MNISSITSLAGLILVIGLLSACQNSKLNITGIPHPPTEGPQEYIIGWQQGCETGMTAYSNSYLRNQYQVRVNSQMMQNPHYQKGWEIGQTYCSYYISSYLSNKELADKDLRSPNTWMKIKSDGFFSYTGFESFDQSFFNNDGIDVSLIKGKKHSLFEGDGTFFEW